MKKLKWLLGLALIGGLIWYFFFKKEHYQIRFTTTQPPGVVYQHIEDWSSFKAEDSLEIRWQDGTRYSSIDQKVVLGNDTIDYHWDILRVSDSTTKVKAQITDHQQYWIQKFKAPLHLGNFVPSNIKRVEDVGEQLVQKSKKFKVHSISDTLFPATFCAYLPVKDIPVNQKARHMLSEIQLLMGYLKEHDIPLAGDPFLQVKHWNEEENTIDFDFCFPIEKTDSLPPTDLIQFQTTAPKKYLKTVFNGNYRISDKAWYYLLDYAQRNDIAIDLLPTEVFLNDPHAGGNSLEWKAHILVPLR